MKPTPPPRQHAMQATGRQPPGLHHVGHKVAGILGLEPLELALLDPTPQLPSWDAYLRVSELVYDSAALASLAITLADDGQNRAPKRKHQITLDAAKIQASFGSEKLFRLNDEAPSIWAPLSGFWKVRDGWVRTHGNYPHHARRLAELLSISTQAERPIVESAMLQWTRFELEEQAAAVGALVIAVREPSEWQAHPQYAVLDQEPLLEYGVVPNAAPRSWATSRRLPLSGVRVLDLTRVIAGPVATRDLAVAGADVLRVDSPQLPEATWQYYDTGQQKRTTLLDFNASNDLTQLEHLLEQTDVLVHGYRPSALAKFGLDFDTLQRRFPGIIVAQLTAWGTNGPWGTRRGFDSLVQAATGIAVLESKDSGATPGALPVQALDHSAGHFLAAAVATALRAQRTTGGSFRISMNLARIAQELLAFGPKPLTSNEPSPSALPTVSVPVSTGEATVICAPPLLAFPGAPSDYSTPLHPWGSDDPVWK